MLSLRPSRSIQPSREDVPNQTTKEPPLCTRQQPTDSPASSSSLSASARPLFYAIEQQDARSARILLEQGWTALYHAAHSSSEELSLLLFNSTGDAVLRDASGLLYAVLSSTKHADAPFRGCCGPDGPGAVGGPRVDAEHTMSHKAAGQRSLPAGIRRSKSERFWRLRLRPKWLSRIIMAR